MYHVNSISVRINRHGTYRFLMFGRRFGDPIQRKRLFRSEGKVARGTLKNYRNTQNVNFSEVCDLWERVKCIT